MKLLTENEKEAIEILESKIQDMRAECRSIPRWKEDELAMCDFALSIERYGGQKGLPWYVYPGLSDLTSEEDQNLYLTDVLRNYGRFKHKKKSKLTSWRKTSDGREIKEKRTRIFLSYPFLDFWKQPPSIDDFRIVTYWEAHKRSENSNGYSDTGKFNEIKEESETENFVKDRLDWGEMQILWMIELLEDLLFQLRKEKEKRKQKAAGRMSGF